MTTPTCLVCGTKFPGDPCKQCNAPAGLEGGDVQAYKRMQLYEQGMSKREVKAAMRPRKGSTTKRQRKHGRHV